MKRMHKERQENREYLSRANRLIKVGKDTTIKYTSEIIGQWPSVYTRKERERRKRYGTFTQMIDTPPLAVGPIPFHCYRFNSLLRQRDSWIIGFSVEHRNTRAQRMHFIMQKRSLPSAYCSFTVLSKEMHLVQVWVQANKGEKKTHKKRKLHKTFF